LKPKDSINGESAEAYPNRISQMYDYVVRRPRSDGSAEIDYNPIAVATKDESFEEV
jgi:hypothetical protein